jgi:hypothetical protein
MPQQLDAQDGGQCVQRSAALVAGLGVVGLNQIKKACKGTTTISERNLYSLNIFLVVVIS